MIPAQSASLLEAWRKAYEMVAGANPWQPPNMPLVARLTRRILLVDTPQGSECTSRPEDANWEGYKV